MKHITSLLLSLALSITAGFAQNRALRIESFTHDPFDQAAKDYPMRDGSGDLRALIKVRPANKDLKFDFGYMSSVVDTKEHEGELWIYVQKNARNISIKGKGYNPILNEDLGITLSGGATYVLQLTIEEPKKTTQTLTVKYAPETAIILIDGNLVRGKNGVIEMELPYGTHKYQAVADGYIPQNGTTELNEQHPGKIFIELDKDQRAPTITENQTTPLTISLTAAPPAEELYQQGIKYCNKKKYTKAVECFRKAAEQGNAAAQFELGYCYDIGGGVRQNYAEGVKWYRKAAEQGYATAQYNLGYCYENGQGVQQDYAQAVVWYRKAAEQGYAKAQNNLGCCYDKGQGVQQDYTQAVAWYRKAAEQGNDIAQYNLGHCYEKGRGVKEDLSQAVEWYRKAAAQGYKSAKKALDRLGYSY